ncbi:hypothetical protein DFH29DRAFT_1072038 [Suillus ampliporus]|nr:hypothetical protein DFH29DRAFT_1072038 [Suillus ampliporus]
MRIQEFRPKHGGVAYEVAANRLLSRQGWRARRILQRSLCSRWRMALSDELDKFLELEVALRPDSFGSRLSALCAEVVICDDAKRGCRASRGAMFGQDGSRVRAGSTRGLDGGVFGGELTDRAGILVLVFVFVVGRGVFTFFADGVIGKAILRSCAGAFLTFTPTVVPMATLTYPPLQRNSEVLNIFSVSPSTSTRMSQEPARIKVDDLRREDGRKGTDAETRVPKVE